MKRQRLDKALVEQDIARSRSHAKELIQADRVLVDGFPASKPATQVEPNEHLEIKGDEYSWVGRGGKKIWPFIDRAWIDPEQAVAIDVGASTGGFTQALLRAGAELVHAVDVGYGQLDYSLQTDDRVHVVDRYNFRHADVEDFQPSPELFVMDVSFISTRKLLPALKDVTEPDAQGLVMVKPQFEAEAHENDEGIVHSSDVVKRVLWEVIESWGESGFGACQIGAVPITGQEGNQEFIVHMDRTSELTLQQTTVHREVHEAMGD